MKGDFDETAGNGDGLQAVPASPPSRPVVTLDVALYEQHLAESDMSEEQKGEFLELLWTIIVGFVDLGFGIDPVRQATPAGGCGQNPETGGSDAADLIQSDDQNRSPDTTPNLRAEIASAVRKGRRP